MRIAFGWRAPISESGEHEDGVRKQGGHKEGDADVGDSAAQVVDSVAAVATIRACWPSPPRWRRQVILISRKLTKQ